MGKLYTLDEKLLIGSPEIRIGDKVFPVDDRANTVKKLMKLKRDDADEIFRLAFGDRYKEIEQMNMPFPAYMELVKLVVAAMTGEDEEELEARFQKAAKNE